MTEDNDVGSRQYETDCRHCLPHEAPGLHITSPRKLILTHLGFLRLPGLLTHSGDDGHLHLRVVLLESGQSVSLENSVGILKPITPVSYTHLRAHETKANLVCRLLLEKKKQK